MKTHFWRAIFGTHVALALQKRSAFCATIKSVDELKPKKKQIFWNFWTAQQKAQIEFEVMAQKHHNLIWFERLTLSQNPREHLRANGQFHSKLSTPIPLFPIRSEIATTIGGPCWFVTLVLGSSWVFLVIRWPRKHKLIIANVHVNAFIHCTAWLAAAHQWSPSTVSFLRHCWPFYNSSA